MDILRNYLDSAFADYSDTPEMLAAKEELSKQMKTRFQELTANGISENKAAGTVIYELGNVKEFLKNAGYNTASNTASHKNAKCISKAEVEDYLRDQRHYARKIALGVFLCIISPVFPIIMDDMLSPTPAIVSALGPTLLFVTIAIAVSLFITSGFSIGKWKFLKYEHCYFDKSTSNYIIEQNNNFRSSYSLRLTSGVVLCILSVVPAILLDGLDLHNTIIDDLSGILVMLFVAFGVFLIVSSSIQLNGYRLLTKIDPESPAYLKTSHHDKEIYSNPTVTAVMSVFWPTVTCIYLCISFLTFSWGVSWIIWPIAAVVQMLIKNVWEVRE